MRTTHIVILAIAFFLATGADFAHGQRRLMVVEEYDINAVEYQAKPRTSMRRLEYLYLYNAAGKIAESWVFLGNYYQRHVFNRDRKGRTTADLMHESVHLPANEYFRIERSRTEVKVLPAVADTLTEITLSQYGSGDDPIEERTTNGEGVLKRKLTREFDRFGILTLQREEDGKGNLVGSDGRRTCTSDGRRCEDTGKADDGSRVKGIAEYDEQHRYVLEELYRYPPASSTRDEPLLIRRAVTSYNGDLTNLDWYLFRDDGTPTQRLMIVHKADREISRKTFIPATDGDGPVTWLPESEELRERTFDQFGNCLLEVWKERRPGEKAYKFTLVHEQVVSWFGGK